MKHLTILMCLLLSTLHTFSQVGIGTSNPKATLDVSGNATEITETDGLLPPRILRSELINKTSYGSEHNGLIIYVTDLGGITNSQTVNITEVGYYYFDGSMWQKMVYKHSYGDIKQGIQASDHDGWVLLNGRAIVSLSSTQQVRAMALGFLSNLPDASNAFLVQNGQPLGNITNSNTKIISQENLPDVNFTGVTNMAGNHSHSNNATAELGGYGLVGRSNTEPYTTAGCCFDVSPGEPNLIRHPIALTINNSGNHDHTVSVQSGGSGTAFDITPKSLSVNSFIFLGN